MLGLLNIQENGQSGRPRASGLPLRNQIGSLTEQYFHRSTSFLNVMRDVTLSDSVHRDAKICL